MANRALQDRLAADAGTLTTVLHGNQYGGPPRFGPITLDDLSTALRALIQAGGGSLTVEEVDGSPSGAVTKIKFPNGTLSIASGVATYTPAGGGGGTPGGSTTQVQFNDAGAFGGDAGFTYDKATDKVIAGAMDTSAANRWTKNQSVAPVALTDASTVTPNAGLSNNFYLLTTSAVGATRTIANPTNTQEGMVLNFEVVQPASGGPCALTFGSKFKWALGGQGTQPSGTIVPGASDFYSGYVQANGDIHIVLIGQAGPQGPAATIAAGAATALAPGASPTVTNVGTSGAAIFDFGIPAGAPGSANFAGTSTTSNAIAVGSTSFTTQAGLAYGVGARVRAANTSSPLNFMEGVVTAYAGTAMTIAVDTVGGSGTFASWTINIAGEPGGGGGGGLTLLGAVSLVSAASTVTFASIPGAYRHLRLVTTCRSTSGGDYDDLVIEFNGDTSASNYRSSIAYGGSSTGSQTLVGAYAGNMSGSASQADAFGSSVIDLPFYTDTNLRRSFNSLSMSPRSGSTHYTFNCAGYWIGTNGKQAITDIVLRTGATFAAGCRFDLYGVS